MNNNYQFRSSRVNICTQVVGRHRPLIWGPLPSTVVSFEITCGAGWKPGARENIFPANREPRKTPFSLHKFTMLSAVYTKYQIEYCKIVKMPILLFVTTRD